MRVRSRRKTVVLGRFVRSMTSLRLSSSPMLWKALSTSQARSTVCDSLRSLRRLKTWAGASDSFCGAFAEEGLDGVMPGDLDFEMHLIFRKSEQASPRFGLCFICWLESAERFNAV